MGFFCIALLLHNGIWEQANPNTYAVKAVGEELDYYFMYGPDFPHLLDLYTSITGKSPMMPDFALRLASGYLCRWYLGI